VQQEVLQLLPWLNKPKRPACACDALQHRTTMAARLIHFFISILLKLKCSVFEREELSVYSCDGPPVNIFRSSTQLARHAYKLCVYHSTL
jgi:hypothetical protein